VYKHTKKFAFEVLLNNGEAFFLFLLFGSGASSTQPPKFGDRILFILFETLSTLNPCEHRAKIVAQAYLKSSKKGKNEIVEYFLSTTL
jgi:hypothetical protein